MIDFIYNHIIEQNIKYSKYNIEEFHLFFLSKNKGIQDFCISTEGGHNYAKLLDIDKILLMVLLENAKEVYVYHNHPEETFAPSIEDLGIASSLFAYLRLFDINIKQQYILCGNSGIYNFNTYKEKIKVVYDDGHIKEEHNLLEDEFYIGAIDLYKDTHKEIINKILSASHEEQEILIRDFVNDFKIGLKKILSANENINVDYFGSIIKEFSSIDSRHVIENHIRDVLVSDLNDVYKEDYLSKNMQEINKLEQDQKDSDKVDEASKIKEEYKKKQTSSIESTAKKNKSKDFTR